MLRIDATEGNAFRIVGQRNVLIVVIELNQSPFSFQTKLLSMVTYHLFKENKSLLKRVCCEQKPK